MFRAAGLLLLLLAQTALSANEPSWLPEVLEKERLTIVVTDSGLGGLSVVADAAEKFRLNPVYREVDLVFVNALFTGEGGYNALQTREQKLAVFSSALAAMQARYDPDLILVACNTLSVLLPETEFLRRSSVPVAGIVETGVDQIAEFLGEKPTARNIMFATRTTVDDGAHRALLLQRGIGDERFYAQACPQLTMYIEQGFDAMDTELLIDAYVDEALSGLGAVSSPLSVSFNCTHFGYSLDAWKLAFESRGIKVEAFLDPNTEMADFLLPQSLRHRFPESRVKVKAVSMVRIPESSIDSIGRYLHAVSPVTEAALRDYDLVHDLFEWRGLVAAPLD